MPTYEYACQKCGHEYEKFHSMRDEPLKKCPKSKNAGLKRLVGRGAGLIFKGTGYYITDNKNKSGGKEGGDKKPTDTISSGSASKSARASSTPANSSCASAKK